MTNKYYPKHKEKFWKEAGPKYPNLSEEEKEKWQGKAGERYQNLTLKEK